ncbi:aldo/keto reductase [Burkholderiaceae bacterium]|jgi:aryl-alcohol dehydrogenase-like predicted oxidoreductase|nr:aldo/keto reductase [Betaproteobacteria bacterium]MDA8600235.1 aldo/keto reductase [Burkholderiaceae bacterium]MCH9846202.1 aldo/keto reductase [Betaproteobacteria bacterium]MDA9885447.1 aldo/keto reductase [Burkholderiaceae bacterium]MDC1457684.1 aldo/keto reductase [Burkholderiaceae bacterium]
MSTRQLGPFQVSATGFGCMNVCHAYGPAASDAQAEAVFNAALDAGVTHFDTAALYGFGLSETWVGKFLSKRRSEFTLASKCGMQGVDVEGDGKLVRVIDGRPATIRQTCEDALKRLNTDVIDLYYLHRWDKQVAIEESVGALADLITAGKIRAIGLSEVSSDTLRRAHREHPIAALQTEYSLWTRNPEISVLQTCRELGTAFVAFSPVARGFLAGTASDPSVFTPKDIRMGMPRFHGDALAHNQLWLDTYKTIAADVGCTPAQLAIAWLLHQGDDILPIPGTGNPAHAVENARADQVTLSAELLARLDALINQGTVMGGRYNAQAEREVDTETFSAT